MVRIAGFHPAGPGSIPGNGMIVLFRFFGPAETACRSTLDHDFRYPTAAATLHFTFELVMQGGENYRRRNECNELSLFKVSRVFLRSKVWPIGGSNP